MIEVFGERLESIRDIINNSSNKYKDKIDDGDVSYYGYIFTRYKDGYPFYSDQITIQIDKKTGYLVGFSNTASQGSAKKAVVNLEISGARQIGLDTFRSKFKNNGSVNDNEIYLDNYSDFSGDD